MADILITGGVVIAVDPQRRIIEDGAVAIERDRIVEVGPTDEVRARHRAAHVIDAGGKAVLPGLWYKACERAYTVGSTPAFWRAEARLAALERLRFGVTTGVSLLGGGDSIMRTDEPDYGDAHCEGVVEVGTRSVVAIGPTRPPHPRTYARWSGEEKREFPVTLDVLANWAPSVVMATMPALNPRTLMRAAAV